MSYCSNPPMVQPQTSHRKAHRCFSHSHHQPVQPTHSIDADSAIEMHDEALTNDSISQTSLCRSVSRTTDLEVADVDSVRPLPSSERQGGRSFSATRSRPVTALPAENPSLTPFDESTHRHSEEALCLESDNRISSQSSTSDAQKPRLTHTHTYPCVTGVDSIATCSPCLPKARYRPEPRKLVRETSGQSVTFNRSHECEPCYPNPVSWPNSTYYTVQTPSEHMSSSASQYGRLQLQQMGYSQNEVTAFPFPNPRLTEGAVSLFNAYDSCHSQQPVQLPVAVPWTETAEISDRRKKKLFRHLITKTLSSVYAIFVVVLGAILYVNDVLGTVGHSYVEVFQIYLFMLAITFYVFIHMDIRRHAKTERVTEPSSPIINTTMEDLQTDRFPAGQHPYIIHSNSLGNQTKETPLNDHHIMDLEERPYYFNTGRHANNLYLKLGAVAFCFGSMIHDGLLFSKRLDIMSTQPFSYCMNVIDLFTPALNLVFSFYQLYFIFKHSNIIIHRYQEIARFGVMHSIAVNLCVWFRTLVDETIDEFSRKWSGENSEGKGHSGKGSPEVVTNVMAEDAGWHAPAPVSGVHAMEYNQTTAALSVCSPETVLANIAQEAAPYLYPFTIEYTLIAAAVWYMIWSNIGSNDFHHANSTRSGSLPSGSHPNFPHPDGEPPSKSSSYMIHVDCRSTNRGLFPGILVLVVTVISIIIFFVTISAEEYTSTALIINNVSELSLYAITGIVTVFAFRKTTTLSLNYRAMQHNLDDFLLLIALPCFFIFSFFSIIAGIAANNPLSIVVNTASTVQVILQTTFIFDGLRRCSDTVDLQRKKPGREMITFLIVCNVAMWTFSTFEIKRSETNPSQMLFYGEFEWSIISHLSVPLTIFYRFHSSVCLVDIWRSAYLPSDVH